MAIDTVGECWTGSEPGDIEAYLIALTRDEGGYRMSDFRPVVCTCSSGQFRLVRGGDITQATCAGCGEVRYISRDGHPIHWEEAVEEEELEPFSCVGCGSREANAGVGFAGYDQHPEIDGVQWFWLGVRCIGCGILDFFNDGKVGYGPVADALRRVTGNLTAEERAA